MVTVKVQYLDLSLIFHIDLVSSLGFCLSNLRMFCMIPVFGIVMLRLCKNVEGQLQSECSIVGLLFSELCDCQCLQSIVVDANQ